MTATPRTLDEMQNRPTAYEVAVDGVVVGYTPRRTKSVLLDYAQRNGEMILSKLNDGEDPEAIYRKSTGWHFGDVRVHFTGRTEREAASQHHG